LQIADSRNFNISTTIAAALVTVRPGGVREMHWNPNTAEWQYYIKGKGRMTVFNTVPNAMTMDFSAGDIGYVEKNLGHYVENIGETDLQLIGCSGRRATKRFLSPTGWRYACGIGRTASQRRRSHHCRMMPKA
jgi:oxalate decarboxylase/phosphoglucose isomerase-like protein (cupin superfamily)